MNKVGKDDLVRGRPQRPPFRNLVSLRQVLSESLDFGPDTKGVPKTYRNLVSHFGSELDVLVEAQVADIAAVGDEKTAEGVAGSERATSPSSPATMADMAPSRCYNYSSFQFP